MTTTKNFVTGFALLVCMLTACLCFADSGVPNMLGKWTVKSEAAFMSKGKTPGTWTHHTQPASPLVAEAVFTKQEGRLLYGTFTSAKATEQFIAVIGLDNKTIYYADQDGFMDARLVDNDTLQVVYRHVSSSDSVVALGVWKRKK